MSYFDFSKIISDDINYSGVAETPDFSIYEENFLIHTIDATEQYRPDKIAWMLWGDENLSWVLDEINEFVDPLTEYYAGRKIKYLQKSYLEKLGIF